MKIGRPVALLDDTKVQQTICDRIRIGMSDKDSALTAGVGESTFYRYMRTGEDHEIELRQHEDGTRPADLAPLTEAELLALVESPYRMFRQEVIKARAECKLLLLNRVSTASREPRHWRAAMGLLAVKWPDEFGRRTVELTGAGGAPLVPTVRVEPTQPLDADAVLAMQQIMERAELIPSSDHEQGSET